MELEKYYGFYFFGEKYERELSKTHTPVDRLELVDLLLEALNYARGLKFKVLFGLVKELSIYNEKILVESPSKVKCDKFQAFILKRDGDIITCSKDKYSINGKMIDMSFGRYSVSILEMK